MKVPSTNESPVVDREKLKQMQCDDKSLQKYWEKDDVVVRGQAETCEVKGGVLYRVYKHPYVNGGKPLTEKFNGTMKSMLKKLRSEQPRQWHRYINPFLFAYREVPHESTGFSPFDLLYGRRPMFILKELWTKELEEPEVNNSYQYVFELRENLEDTLKLAHTELQKAQNKGKHYYNRKTKIRKFLYQ